MNDVTCVGLIPAEQIADPTAGLNVLVMAVNSSGQEAAAPVSLYGCVDTQPRELVCKVCTLSPGEHAHLYFHIPPRCFSPEFWDGETPEEMTLFAGVTAPQTIGVLLFIEA